MSPSSPHYLPLPLPYFTVLGAALLGVIIVVELRALRLAYERAGLGSRAAVLILIGSLVGSYSCSSPRGKLWRRSRYPFWE